MKTWLEQLRTSFALDGEQPSFNEANLNNGSAELRRVDEKLRHSAPTVCPPPNLHESIMRAVELAERRASKKPVKNRIPLLAGSAFAALAIVAYFGLQNLQKDSAESLNSSFVGASSAFDLGGRMMMAVPTNAISPLVQEMQSLNKDFTNTGEFLLASLP